MDNGLTGRDGRWGGWVLLWELGPTLYVTTPLEVAPTRGGDVHWGVVSTLGSCAGRGSGLVWIWIGGGISAAVPGFHIPKRSLILVMASSWLWCDVAIIGEELQDVDDAVVGIECGLDYRGVPVLHSVTDDLSLGVCIHYSMASVVVESRAYAVAIIVTEIPCLACVGLAVYEETAACGTKWGVNLVKWAVEVFPS